ncbi:hypothetical protein [Chitinibacter sp. GC72]|jgi:hypothetical protein|uniref:hypothetical protein n=1 Tax=Chitinibacter sp. GC72 TaxID=1526917 RepID=UPI0012F979C2|nr:hypothetical protein [Chitinibacter sp. GC72]
MNKLQQIALASCLAMVSAFSMAAAENGTAVDTAGSIGRIIGLALFGYIVLKIVNRNK